MNGSKTSGFIGFYDVPDYNYRPINNSLHGRKSRSIWTSLFFGYYRLWLILKAFIAVTVCNWHLFHDHNTNGHLISIDMHVLTKILKSSFWYLESMIRWFSSSLFSWYLSLFSSFTYSTDAFKMEPLFCLKSLQEKALYKWNLLHPSKTFRINISEMTRWHNSVNMLTVELF